MQNSQTENNKGRYKHLCIIGCGLIGSSIARAAASYGAADTITLYDSNAEVRKALEGLSIGIVAHDLATAVADADLVILCTPVGKMGDVAQAIRAHLKPGTCISDVGSVKQSVSQSVRAQLPAGVHFIPGHPIAGTEKSGPEAGFAELFQEAWHLLCPFEDTPPDALTKLTQFWERLGAKVDTMDAAQHDRVLAITSHLPHLIAFNIVGTASDMESIDTGEVVKYSASGFRDFTRIASSDPIMWRDVFLNNKEAILEILGRFTEDLIAMQRAIRWDDEAYIVEKITRARAIREDILGKGPGDFIAPPENKD